jgi:hypothetical protein
MSTIAQAERWLRDRTLGKDTFNFAIELRNDIAKSSNPPIIGAVGTFHLPEVGYSMSSLTVVSKSSYTDSH